MRSNSDVLELWKTYPLRFTLALALFTRAVWLLFAHLGTQDMVDPHIVFTPHMDLDVWVRWDSTFYITLARDGYQATESGDVAFFPLYPLTVAAVAKVTMLPHWAAALMVANACDLAGWLLLAQLARVRLGDGQASLLAMAAFAMFPTRNFGFSAYSEGLFLCTSVGAFLAYERGQTKRAACIAAFCSAVRPQGILVGLALVGDAARQRRWRDAVLLVASCAGLVAYMAYLGERFGRPLYFMELQGKWHRQLANPLQAFMDWSSPLASVALWLATMTALRMLRHGAPVRDKLYVCASLLLPLSSGSTLSMARFVGVVFPLFVFAAAHRAPKAVGWLYAACAIAWSLAMAYAVGTGDVVL